MRAVGWPTCRHNFFLLMITKKKISAIERHVGWRDLTSFSLRLPSSVVVLGWRLSRPNPSGLTFFLAFLFQSHCFPLRKPFASKNVFQSFIQHRQPRNQTVFVKGDFLHFLFFFPYCMWQIFFFFTLDNIFSLQNVCSMLFLTRRLVNVANLSI